MADMTEAELKVTLAAIRKTLGYHKQQDPISLTQFQEMTGLARQAVIDGVEAAMSRGLIEKVGTGKRGVVIYGLVLNSDQSTQETSSGMNSRPDTGMKFRHTKEKKEKVKKERSPRIRKGDLTELEQWTIRLKSIDPALMSAILARMEQGYDPIFHTPETYLTIALMEKYVPLAEEVYFYKPTPEQFFAFYRETKAVYDRNGWTIGVKTVREKFPGFMARQIKASNITPVDPALDLSIPIPFDAPLDRFLNEQKEAVSA